MKNKSDLTAFELDLLHELEKSDQIKWIHCRVSEVRGLNRLVKKGFAIRSDDRETWTLSAEHRSNLNERIRKCQKQSK